MTGKDLVLYIINNNLLDTEFNAKAKDLFLTVEEAAVKLGISTTSLQDMIKLGIVDYVVFDEIIYVHKDIQLTSLHHKKQGVR